MAKERVRIERQSYKRAQIRTSLDVEFNTFKEKVEEVDLESLDEGGMSDVSIDAQEMSLSLIHI